MPNHVMNRLEFDCSKEQMDEILAAICYDEGSDEAEVTGPGTIDFNKITPMPPSLNIESGSRTIDGISLYLTSRNPDVHHFGEKKMELEEFHALLVMVGKTYGFISFNPSMSQEEIANRTKYTSADELLELGKAAVDNKRLYGATTWYEWRTRPDTWNAKWNSYYPEDYNGGNEIAFQTAWSPPHPIIRKLSEMFPEVKIQHRWANEDPTMGTGYSVYLGGEELESYAPVAEKDMLAMSADIWGYDPEESEDMDLEQD